MAKKQKKAKPLSSVFASNATTASKALDAALASKPEVIFSLAWIPENKSPVYIRSVKANDDEKIPETGVIDSESPFTISLGNFASGTKVTISWAVRAYNDLSGIRAFAGSSSDTEWSTLGTKYNLGAGEQWEASKAYTVK